MLSLGVIIPCFNEEESLPQLKERLKEFDQLIRKNYEPTYFFVDDGSTDKTNEILKDFFQAENHHVLTHDVNSNLGAALKTGLNAAKGFDRLCFLDSDCTYDPIIIVSMFEQVEKGADVVVVSPYHPEGGVEGVPRWRLSLSLGLSLIYRFVTRAKIHTFTAMVWAMKSSALPENLSSKNDFTFLTETLFAIIKKGFKVEEKPTILSQRRFGQSKMRVLATIKSHLGIIKKIILRQI